MSSSRRLGGRAAAASSSLPTASAFSKSLGRKHGRRSRNAKSSNRTTRHSTASSSIPLSTSFVPFARRWVLRKNHPLGSCGLEVSMWVPVDSLTSEELEEYTTSNNTKNIPGSSNDGKNDEEKTDISTIKDVYKASLKSETLMSPDLPLDSIDTRHEKDDMGNPFKKAKLNHDNTAEVDNINISFVRQLM
jgi:hypothetical protein